MNLRVLVLVRRTLALAAMLATLSGAVAPVCASMAMKAVAASHCGDSKDQEMPSPSTPGGSSDHHAPVVCTMVVCVAIPMVPASPALGHVLPSVPVQSAEVALISAVPQHTTPPPRS